MKKSEELLDKFYEHTATFDEKRQLTEMLKQEGLWEELLNKTCHHSFGQIPPSIDRRMEKRIRLVARPKPKLSWLGWMHVVLIAMFVGLAVYSVGLWNENQILSCFNDMEVRTGKGQKIEITLPDGSNVYLNSDSHLQYGKTFNGQKRWVKLSGEAYFEVRKKDSAPFVVQTAGVEILATGTAFNVEAYPESGKIVTFLNQGSVTLYSEQKNLRLIPGEVSVYNCLEGKLSKSSISDPRLYTGWMNNEMIVENLSLPQVLVLFERYYRVKFKIESDALAQITFSGTLKNNSLIDLLDGLRLTSGIYYTIEHDVVKLYSNHPNTPSI